MLGIEFEFVGGPHDGMVLNGLLGEGSDAERCYLSTNEATVGYLFKVASEYAIEILLSEGTEALERHHLQRHFYAVAERVEEQGEVYVRAEYLATAALPPGCTARHEACSRPISTCSSSPRQLEISIQLARASSRRSLAERCARQTSSDSGL